MTDFRIEKTTDAEVARIGNRILEIFKEDKLSSLEASFILTQVWDRIEKELDANTH